MRRVIAWSTNKKSNDSVAMRVAYLVGNCSSLTVQREKYLKCAKEELSCRIKLPKFCISTFLFYFLLEVEHEDVLYAVVAS